MPRPGAEVDLPWSPQDLAEWLCDQGDEALKASSLVELSSRRQVLMEKLEATAAFKTRGFHGGRWDVEG